MGKSNGIIGKKVTYKDALNDNQSGKVVDRIDMKVQYKEGDEFVVVTGYLVRDDQDKLHPVPYYAIYAIE